MVKLNSIKYIIQTYKIKTNYPLKGYVPKIMSKELIRVRVTYHAESEKSIGVLVDLLFDENGRNTSASNLKWFPKSLCSVERIEPVDPKKELPSYFLTAPKWIIDKNINNK